jgi:hypothetical protein
MSFLRHLEIYRLDGFLGRQKAAERGWPAPRPHRTDEFPAGYSSASCSPAELASASPVNLSVESQRIVGNGLPANGNLSLLSVPQPWGAVQSVPLF